MVILIKGMKIYSCRLILIAVQYSLSSYQDFALQDHGLIKKRFPQLIKKPGLIIEGVLCLRGVLYSSKYGRAVATPNSAELLSTEIVYIEGSPVPRTVNSVS